MPCDQRQNRKYSGGPPNAGASGPLAMAVCAPRGTKAVGNSSCAIHSTNGPPQVSRGISSQHFRVCAAS
jgi:hypothetical protein